MRNTLAQSLRAVSDVEHLRRAWLNLSDAKKGGQRNVAGVDGVTINQFAQKADEYLGLISLRLRTGAYSFSQLKAHLEPKSNGKRFRVICVPVVRDRIVQRALVNYLTSYSGKRYAFENSVSFGFIAGKTVVDAVTQAKSLRMQKRWAYKTDISSFFDSIDREVLCAQISRKLRCRGLHGLIREICACEIKKSNDTQGKRIRAEGIKSGIGLRQGMPMSPYLSNLLLADFDKRVVAKGISMVRYADDLVFFASSEGECRNIHDFCVAELAKLKLVVHEIGTDKSVIAKPNEPVDFLGVELALKDGAYTVRISESQFEKKKTELLAMQNFQELLKQRITLSKFIRTVDAKIAGWLDAYSHCDNLEVLRDKLRDWRLDLLNAVLVDGLGIKTPSLAVRQFLELAPLSSIK